MSWKRRERTVNSLSCEFGRFTSSFRASLHEPGLDTDPGQFSVEYYVYMSPGWVRVGSFSADPGQFPFAGLKGLVTTCQ